MAESSEDRRRRASSTDWSPSPCVEAPASFVQELMARFVVMLAVASILAVIISIMVLISVAVGGFMLAGVFLTLFGIGVRATV